MKTLLKTLRPFWLALLFVALNIALLARFYAQLPDPLPMLWHSDGTIIMWLTKPVGALLLPLVQLLVTAILIAAPSLDPGTLGASWSMQHALLGGIGVLFALIGNYLCKVPRNFMVGIRTPWTLASDYVWERTHRFAAPLFVVGGVCLVVHCLTQDDALSWLFISSIVAVTILAPYCYSMLLWKRISDPDPV